MKLESLEVLRAVHMSQEKNLTPLLLNAVTLRTISNVLKFNVHSPQKFTDNTFPAVRYTNVTMDKMKISLAGTIWYFKYSLDS